MAGVTKTITLTPIESLHSRIRPRPPDPSSTSRVRAIEGTTHPSLNGLKGRMRMTPGAHRMDPQLMLEPARKKLSTVEAQRIMGALQEAIRRAEIMASVPYILRNLKRFRIALGAELIRALEDHRAVLESFCDLQASEEMFRERESRTSSASCASGKKSRQSAKSAEDDSRRSDPEEPTKRYSDIGDEVWTDDSTSSAVKRQTGLDDGYDAGWQDGLDGDADCQSDARNGESALEGRQQGDLNGQAQKLDKTAQSMSRPTEDGEESEHEEEEEGSASARASSMARSRQRTVQRSQTNQPLSAISRTWSQLSKANLERPCSQAEQAHRHLNLVAVHLQESCRNLLRLFLSNPTAATEVVKDSEEDWSEDARRAVEHLKDLKTHLMLKLLMTPMEELNRAKCLREILEKDQYNAGIISKLSAELKAAEEEKREAIKEKTDVATKLKSTLNQIQKTSEDNIRRMKLDAEKQEAGDKKNTQGRMTKLQQDLTQVQSQYNGLCIEHHEKELQLRTKKYQIETEVENWIQKYDFDMGERQDEYERVDLVYTEEKRQLNELEEKFKTLEAEYQSIQEERRNARAAREIAERELQMCIRAATTIQAFWRSFKVRKAIKLKRKKSKKGKVGMKKGRK